MNLNIGVQSNLSQPSQYDKTPAHINQIQELFSAKKEKVLKHSKITEKKYIKR